MYHSNLIAMVIVCHLSLGIASIANAKQEHQLPTVAIKYIPPNVGTATGRIGGGTRNLKINNPLLALAPKHTGLTTNSQPRLYWYLTPGLKCNQQFHLRILNGATLLKVEIPCNNNGGIQSIDLKAYGIQLSPGKKYRWQIKLEPSPHHSIPTAAMTVGYVQLVKPSISFSQATMSAKPFIAASCGLWYDAIMTLSDLIKQEPSNTKYWRLQRARLLGQVGLIEVAIYEKQLADAQ